MQIPGDRTTAGKGNISFMKQTNAVEIIGYRQVESKVIAVKGQKVLLDSDVADLYGVETKEINQAVKNNADKFPNGYIIELTSAEKTEQVKIFDRFNSLKHSNVLPKAFT
jgi:hypothetical protein